MVGGREDVVRGKSLMRVSLGDEPGALSGVAIVAGETRQRTPDREPRKQNAQASTVHRILHDGVMEVADLG